MSEVAHATPAQEVKSEGMRAKENTGTLQGPSKEYSVFLYAETADASKSALAFLTEVNDHSLGEDLAFEAMWITPELAALEHEIGELLNLLSSLPPQEKNASKGSESSLFKEATRINKNPANKNNDVKSSLNRSHTPNAMRSGTVFSSLFSLARSVHQNQKAKGNDQFYSVQNGKYLQKEKVEEEI